MAKPPAADIWTRLRGYTQARIGLGRTGHSIPLAEVLDFQFAHARARDAVVRPVDFSGIQAALPASAPPRVEVHSQARDRAEYLLRPDLGRRLDSASRARLEAMAESGRASDVAFVIADGLSAIAVERHAGPIVARMLSYAQREAWAIAPIVCAHQGRVALSDEIGAALRARVVAMLIGERPGLSSADSLGIYLTYDPRVGNTDAGRNCISNVHANGLSYDLAAHKLHFLLRESLRLKLSGVGLKDTSDTVQLAAP